MSAAPQKIAPRTRLLRAGYTGRFPPPRIFFLQTPGSLPGAHPTFRRGTLEWWQAGRASDFGSPVVGAAEGGKRSRGAPGQGAGIRLVGLRLRLAQGGRGGA